MSSRLRMAVGLFVGALFVLAVIAATQRSALAEAERPPAAAAALTAPAAAAATGKQPYDAQTVQQAEQFRSRLFAWTTDMEAVLDPLTVDMAAPPTNLVATLRTDIADMNTGELLQLEDGLSKHPAYWELPAFIHAMLEPTAPVPPAYAAQLDDWERRGLLTGVLAQSLRRRVEADGARGSAGSSTLQGDSATGRSRDGSAAPASVSGGAQPAAVLTPNPTATVPYPSMPEFPTPRPDLPEQPDSREGCPGVFIGNICDDCGPRIPLAAIYAVHVAAIIAGGVTDSLDADMEDCTCTCPLPMPRPICIPFPNIAYYVANSIRIALEATERSLEFVNTLTLECEDNISAAIMEMYLDATVSSRVTQDSFDLSAQLVMQGAIESNLLRPSDERIGLFQQPQDVCSQVAVPDDDPSEMTGYEGYRFCGKLELVRQIVSDTINRNAAADMLIDIAGARAKLAAGDAQYEVGHWKSAYERFSEAYRMAVQEESRR